MNWLKTFAAVALVQAAVSLPAHAGDNLQAVKSAGVLKVGTEGTTESAPKGKKPGVIARLIGR